MTEAAKRSNAVFWIALVPLLLAVFGTIALVVGSRLRSPDRTPLLNYAQTARPNASATVDAAVAKDGAKVCAAFRALAHGDDPIPPGAIWKQLGVAQPPADPWGTSYEWEPWSRSLRSFGADKVRATPDDQLVRCE